MVEPAAQSPVGHRNRPGATARTRPSSRTPSDPPVREAIGIARVLCILGIVYVHAWTGRSGDELIALAETPQGVLRWVLIELVGRCAVPLLGAISGWLAGPSAIRRGAAGFRRVKARTILAPMLLWNLIALALVSGAATLGHLKAPVPAGVWQAIDWTGCLTEPNPINVQIAFLRDLFLCMLAAPGLARLPDRWLWAIAGLAAAWAIGAVDLYLLLRPQILLFFVIGLIARRRGWAERVSTLPFALAIAPYLLLVAPKAYLSIVDERWLQAHVAVANAIDLPLRVAAAIAVWRSAIALARRAATVTPLLAIERYAFFLFCLHVILIWLLGPVLGLVTGPLGSPAYPAYLLLQPLLVLVPAVAIGRMLEAGAPGVAAMLSGGRLSRRLPVRAASAMERA